MDVRTDRRSTTLSAHFESNRLFVATWIEGLGSTEEARALLRDGLNLDCTPAGITVRSGTRALRVLCEHEGDELGRWRETDDRRLQEDSWSARISVAGFSLHFPKDGELKLEWWAITDYTYDAYGDVASISLTASGSTDTPERDERPSDSDRRMAAAPLWQDSSKALSSARRTPR